MKSAGCCRHRDESDDDDLTIANSEVNSEEIDEKEEAWAQQWGIEAPRRISGTMLIPTKKEDVSEPLPTLLNEASRKSAFTSVSQTSAQTTSPVNERPRSGSRCSAAQPTLVSQKSKSLPDLGQLDSETLPKMSTSAFIQAEAVPDAGSGEFVRTEPVCSKKIPGLSTAQLQKILHAEPFIMETCLKQDIKAYDMKPSRWQEGVNTPGTQIRAMRYRMPVPDDVPSAAKSLLTIPEFCTCQTFVRLRFKPEELDMTFQTISQGMPFGENLRLQVTNSFTPYADHTGAGVIFRRWIVVAWVKELPWAIRFLKSAVVSQIMQAGKESASVLADLILQQKTAIV